MSIAVKRQLDIAQRQGLVVGNLDDFLSLSVTRKQILGRNLDHLLMWLNQQLSAIAVYKNGDWVH